MYNFFINLFRKQQYTPNLFIGPFLNPFYIARSQLHKCIKSKSHYISGNVLDVGCGTKPYMNIFDKVIKYTGLEIEKNKNNKADYYYDGITMPFENNSFDSILCNQVIEHVFNPEEFLSEINRILKKDSFVIFTVPFVWDEHETPYDYSRYSSFGIKHLFNKHNLKVIELIKLNSNFALIAQLLILFFFNFIPKNKFAFLIFSIFCSPITYIGIIISKFLPKNKGLYLDQLIIAKKIEQEVKK